MEEAIATNEPTDARENVTNEPTATHAFVTNEPTVVPEIVTNEPTNALAKMRRTNPPRSKKRTNEPTADQENMTNEPIEATTVHGASAARSGVYNGQRTTDNGPSEIVTNEPTAAEDR